MLWDSVERETDVSVWGTLLHNFDPVKRRIGSASVSIALPLRLQQGA